MGEIGMENGRPGLKARLLGTVSATVIFALIPVMSALALPQYEQLVDGVATIANTSATRMDITQTTDKAILDWRSFSIGSAEYVEFHQPSTSSIAMNRVTGADPSSIFGHLTANGIVFLSNPNGVLFGAGSRVDVAGLVATTAGITNDNFLAGNNNFSIPSLFSGATVRNEGEISVADLGMAALVAPGVSNSGIIRARLGKVTLGGAQTFTLDLYGDQLVQFAAGSVPPAADQVVANSGLIQADGGTVMLSAATAEGVLGGLVSMTGVIEARSVENRNGEIILSGGPSGTVEVSGTLDASGLQAGQTGGTVKVLGDKVFLQNGPLQGGALVDVSGDAGGGTALIGGNFQGKGPEQNAKETTLVSLAVINADAITSGNGGKVVMWSDGTTHANGTISARGGAQGGNGGNVETSGHILDVLGIKVDTSAPMGITGNWLLDPSDFTVGVNITGVNLGLLLNNNNITIQTGMGTNDPTNFIYAGNGSVDPGDITINEAVSWAGSHTLTLYADRNININANISGYTFNLTTKTGLVTIANGLSLPTDMSIAYTYTGNIYIGGSSSPTIPVSNLINNLGYSWVRVYGSGGNITVDAPLSWTSTKTLQLTGTNIYVNSNISAPNANVTFVGTKILAVGVNVAAVSTTGGGTSAPYSTWVAHDAAGNCTTTLDPAGNCAIINVVNSQVMNIHMPPMYVPMPGMGPMGPPLITNLTMDTQYAPGSGVFSTGPMAQPGGQFVPGSEPMAQPREGAAPATEPSQGSDKLSKGAGKKGPEKPSDEKSSDSKDEKTTKKEDGKQGDKKDQDKKDEDKKDEDKKDEDKKDEDKKGAAAQESDEAASAKKAEPDKAVDKAVDKADKAVDKAADKADKAVAKAADKAEKAVDKAADKADKAVAKAADKADKAVDKAADKADKATDKAADKADKAVDKAEDKADKAVDKAADKVAEKADKAADKAAEKADKATDKAADKADKATDKAEDKADKAAEKAEKAADKADKAADKAAEKADKAAEKADEAADKAVDSAVKAIAPSVLVPQSSGSVGSSGIGAAGSGSAPQAVPTDSSQSRTATGEVGETGTGADAGFSSTGSPEGDAAQGENSSNPDGKKDDKENGDKQNP